MEKITIKELENNRLQNLMSDCLKLGMRVYITTHKDYTNTYFTVSDKNQEYFAYYQTGYFHSSASTSTNHKPNKKTGTGYQLYTEEQPFDHKKRAFVETTYTPSKISAEHIKNTLEQSELNIKSGKEQKALVSDIFWDNDNLEVVIGDE